ncbi:MAG: hypothetical protein K6T99_08150 [Armatimonadetes bacterium]|nr:hypothetical protein [Armatimonadota bacterium]
MKTVHSLLFLLIVASNALAFETVVWQIGKADNSYGEFALAGNYNGYAKAFPKDVTFQPDKDDPSKAWSFIHPGPSDSWAGSKPHGFTIIFNLPRQPKGVFSFTIDMVDTHASAPPAIKLSINGQSGIIKLAEGAGDDSLVNPRAGREYVFSTSLPASTLRKGENKIEILNEKGSWFLYDAVILKNDPEGVVKASVKRIELHPTIRFVRSGRTLMQVVDLEAEFTNAPADCKGILRMGEWSTAVTLNPPFLGILRKELAVPKVHEPSKLELFVEVGEKTATASCEVKPERHWLFYLQPSSHVDIGYTDFQDKVIKLHNDNMSLALSLCKKYPGFVWNTEAAWVEDNYLSLMPPEKADDFLRAAKEGQIGCQAVYGNMLTGICSHESFIRTLYFAHSIARKYGIPFDIAMSSDVPTQVWTLPTVLAQSGIKYFSAGLNLTRGDSFNKLFGKSPFYWRGPDGSKVLTWYMNGYAKAVHSGLAIDIDRAKAGVESLLREYDRDDYPYDAILGFGGYGDNQRLSERLAKTVQEWNDRYAYPRIILCRGPEFFEYIEHGFKDKIPTIEGDGGVYWEDGAGSSARETALVRIAKEDLVTAEKVFSLASTIFGEKHPKDEFDTAWKNAILYDEHTWGAHCSISQPQSEQTTKQWVYKARFAYNASRQAKKVLQAGLRSLVRSVKADKPSLLVFNPLDVSVSGLVLARNKSGELVELWAEDVPPLGYRVFPLSTANPMDGTFQTVNTTSQISIPKFENQFYRLEIDPLTGAVKSLIDKELNRDLVDSKSPYGLNRYLYVSGHGESMTIHADARPVKISTALLPYRRVIRIDSSAYMTPELTTEIVLWDKIKRIDFNNTLRKKGTYMKEAGYFAFPFNLKKPEFHIEIPDGIIQPSKDMLPGACMQWYCAQDFVVATEPGCTIVWTALESPLITLGDINRDTFQSPLPIDNGHLYAYIFNNYWFTNYKASQSGQFTFRFSLTSMAEYNPVAASRFGRSVRNPLIAAEVAGKGEAGVHTLSLVSVAPSSVIIQALKPAESGKGIIVRLREVAGRDAEAVLQLPAMFKRAWKCNLVEDVGQSLPISKGTLKVALRPNGMATVLLSP